jgi:hypothetical protein
MALNQAQPYREIVLPFHTGGIVLKLDPELLKEAQFQQVLNMEAFQEGALRSRNGYRNLTPTGIAGEGGGILAHVHTLARLASGTQDPGEDILYVGNGQYVYRLAESDPLVVIPSIAIADLAPGSTYAAYLGTETTLPRWAGVEYAKGSAGKAYFFIASSGKMLKDAVKDTFDGLVHPMFLWGIDRPAWAAQAEAHVGAAGNLISSFAPYTYVYTFRNPITGQESNPSTYMVEGIVTEPEGNPIDVWVWPESPANVASGMDPQIAYSWRNIVIYRAGGSFSDGLYRRVLTDTRNANDGALYWQDDIPDADIASNPTLEIDNDRPVTAALPQPFSATLSSYSVLEAGSASVDPIVGKVWATITVETGVPAGQQLSDVLTPGTLVRVGQGTESEEFCTVISVADPSAITLVFQKPHAAGDSIDTSSRANSPCRFACVAHDSIFLAGNKDNPDTLYKSKTGRPESFPAVADMATGAPGSIRVGTPSDPIMNLVEFNNEVICLNRQHIYHVPVMNGYMQTPTKTAAQRGLLANWAWCVADNEIWYLAYDGVYSWSGGVSQKRSEAIDPIFNGETFAGFAPISLAGESSRDGYGLTDLDKILFSYSDNKIYIAYNDTSGARRRIYYHTLYQRWHADSVDVDGMLQERDTGRFLLLRHAGGIATINLADSAVSSAETDTTDGWTADQSGGSAITWQVKTGWYSMGMPAVQKQFGDVVLELENPGNAVAVQVYYDYSETLAESFTITAAAGRRRVVLNINDGLAKEACAIMFRFSGSSVTPTALYNLTFHWLPLAEIQGGRATDWDNLGHPHDKRLQQMSLEHDVDGVDTSLYLDVMYGINGASQQLAVQTFTLTSPAASDLAGPTRARHVYPINLDYPVKLVRLRADVPLQQIKLWDYHFDFLPYPPDIVLFTEWTDMGYAGEKWLREVSLEIDTGDVECAVQVEADGVVKRRFGIKTTMDARFVVLTLNEPGDEEVIGTQFRLTCTPGSGGKAQLFNHKFHGVPEPIGVRFWDSGVQNFAANTFKMLKQVWLQYRSCGGIRVRLYTDTQQLLQTVYLPPHKRRDVERFYVDLASDDGVYNKSKTYRITVESLEECGPVHIYHDGCRVEWATVGADMRQGYQQAPLFEPMERSLMP